MAETVSIVITVYNEEPRHLAEAIESARNQTIPATEIIIVEDGARRDYTPVYGNASDLSIIRQKNQGLASARNTGLRAAKGRFILFLDGDDRLMPSALAFNLRRFETCPGAVMAYGGYRMIDSDGSPSFQSRMPPLGTDAYATFLEGNCIGMHATVLYRRDALLALGGFDASFRACEDYELYLRMARHGQIVPGSELIAEYRHHGANMSGDRAMMLRTALRVLDKQNAHVASHPDWKRARRAGREGWKQYYARGQLAAVQDALASGKKRSHAVRGLGRMMTFIPFTTAKAGAMEILGRMKQRLRHSSVDLGDLRRITPISRHFGYDRGLPVDRRYIEDFLGRYSADIHGRVLEVGDNAYTMQFGKSRVEKSEVLHVDPEAPNVTYCTDLTEGKGIPDGTFDCIVLTQTLHLVYEFQKAVATLDRVLKPGGVLLLTVPGVSSIDKGEWGDTWFWSFTPASLRRLMETQFGKSAVEIASYGNVLTATAFLYGLAESDLRPHEYHVTDPQYPVIVTARVVKAAHGAASA